MTAAIQPFPKLDQRYLDAMLVDVVKEARKRINRGNDPYVRFQARYRDQPAKFVQDCIIFTDGERAAFYQLGILDQLVEHKRVAVRGPRGEGKTCIAAWAVLWFALTRDGNDWKVPTTASVWRQVEEYLWPEVHKWARKLRWLRIGRSPFTHKELMKVKLELDTGHAFGLASTDPSYVEGAHAKHLLYIFDEARRLDISTPIPIPTGWTTMGELEVGDIVFDEMGSPTRVTYVSPVLYDRPCSLVIFSDDSELIADPGHLWATLPNRRRRIWRQIHTNDPRYKRKYPRVKDWRCYWDKAEVVETSSLLNDVDGRRAIPTCYPLKLPFVELPIDPYVLGAWLGDGSSRKAVITSMDQDILDRIAADGHEITQRTHLANNRAQAYGIVRGGLETALRKFNLLQNKHIPGIYLRASIEQRLDLLRGLMDTDGTVMSSKTKTDSRASFCNTNRRLAYEVAELVRTFGWKVRVRETVSIFKGKVMGPKYILRWSADVCPFYIKRKVDRWVPREAQASRSTARTIASVTSVPSVPTRCIAVDSPRHLYLAGEDFIPTHNSIPDPIWDSTEGAFASPDTAETLALAISTPGEPVGRFFDIHAQRPGLEEWFARHITIEEAIRAKRISAVWVENKKALWGETSSQYQNQVLGNFATSDDEGLIPIHWVEAANDRYNDYLKGTLKPTDTTIGIGIDIGRTRDQSIIVTRAGPIITDIHRLPTTDTMGTTGLIISYLRMNDLTSYEPVVDVAGIGAGVVDRLREQGVSVIAYHASGSTDFKDKSGELDFLNKRAAGWWKLREELDPGSETALALPRDDILLRELTAPHWASTSAGKIKIESKAAIRKRIHRSTDTADALIMALYGAGIESSFSGGTVGVIRWPIRRGTGLA